MMRITNQMISNNYMVDLNRSMNRMDKLYQEMTSGKKISKLSDDPVGMINSLAARSKLARLDIYDSNITTCRAWLTDTETAMSDLNDTLKTAYEQAVDASSGTKGPAEKKAIASYIAQLIDHAVGVGNSSFGDKYIFAGYNTTEKPFAFDMATGVLTYNGKDVNSMLPLDDSTPDADRDAESGQAMKFEIGFGVTMEANVTGLQLFGSGPDNTVANLYGLYQSLMNDEGTSQIMQWGAKLQSSQQDTLSNMADVGGRQNRLDLITNRYDAERINYRQMQSDAEDVDEEEVIMYFKMAEAVYQAALAAGSRIIQPTLMDYLR